MHEAVLRDFFLGDADSARLRDDLRGGITQRGASCEHHIVDMNTELAVRCEHLVRLCDAALAGELPYDALEQIGFCLIASDQFHWDSDTPDGAVVAETIHDWACPAINWPLNQENIQRFRDGLAQGQYLFERRPMPGRGDV